MRNKTKNCYNDIINDYVNTNLTTQKIADKYGVTSNTITNVLKKHNIPWRTRKGGLTAVNENYFETIDAPDKAYFLGFITGDGHISHNKNKKDGISLVIKLARKDSEILEKFKNFCKSEHTILYSTRINPKIQTKPSEMCSLKISCTKLCLDVIKHGVTNKKSKILNFPTTIPDELLCHYIRGLIDSDGGWTFHKRKNYTDHIILMFCSSVESFINEVQNYLITKLKLNKTVVTANKKGTYFAFKYGGNIVCKKLYHYLYDHGGPWLERKYNKSSEHFIKIKNFKS